MAKTLTIKRGQHADTYLVRAPHGRTVTITAPDGSILGGVLGDMLGSEDSVVAYDHVNGYWTARMLVARGSHATALSDLHRESRRVA